MPSGPARTSSRVPGLSSGPGSATMPESVVPGTAAVLTVVNVVVSVLPGVPLPAASSRLPSAALIVEPSTVSVIVEAPGRGLVKNSQA